MQRATLAAIRFGMGLCPSRPGAPDAAALMDSLRLPDDAERWPFRPWGAILAEGGHLADLLAARRRGDPLVEPEIRAILDGRRAALLHELRQSLGRAVFGASPLRERLVGFWANHFTAVGDAVNWFGTAPVFENDAIRPHVTGRFADLLRAAVLHPVMLIYLDQDRSAGPNSPAARDHGMGLNENLAREVLELHTMGAAGAYAQADVEALALILTGAAATPGGGFAFRPYQAEPGRMPFLGRSYGGRRAHVERIELALEALSLHPDTARHITGKLARHFVADQPDPALTDHMAATYLATGGDLMAVYGAMLDHPAAWADDLQKARSPFEFLAASLRALDLTADALAGMDRAALFHLLHVPMQHMGQTFAHAPSPAGYPDTARDWISPQGLAARIDWAITAPAQLTRLPDPRDFVGAALGDAADAGLRAAVAGAESRGDGIGLILSAPAFNRR